MIYTRVLGMDIHRMSQVDIVSKLSRPESGVKAVRPDLVPDFPRAGQDSVSIRFAGKGDAETPDSKLYALLKEKTPVSREAVDALIQAGADLNGKRDDSPLCDAAWTGQIEAVKYFIEKKADLNKGRDGRTALHLAIYKKHPEIVNLLIEAGADIHRVRRWGSIPLGEAALVGDEKTFELLLAKGADPKVLGDDKKTMLYDAVDGGNPSILKRLLAFGLDPNKQETGVTAVPVLMRAVEKGRADLVEALLDAGADAKAKFFEGYSMFHVLGKEKNQVEMTTVIGPDTAIIDHQEVLKPDTPSRRGQLDKIVKRLVAAGVDINGANELGETPLTEAHGLDVLEVLLQNGANVNAYDHEGLRLLDHALEELKEWQSMVPNRPEDVEHYKKEIAKAEKHVALLKKYGAKKRWPLNLQRMKTIAQIPFDILGAMLFFSRRH